VNRTLWHYTVGDKLRQILETGAILPATTYVPEGERPIVWFSLNLVWEPTANKGWRNVDGTISALDQSQTAERCGGLVRIGVAPETAPYDWHTLKQLSGMSSKTAQGLYRVAIQERARPGDWRGTFDPVPRSKWIAIEIFHDGGWVPVPFEAVHDDLNPGVADRA
jgi:hypothetical protein